MLQSDRPKKKKLRQLEAKIQDLVDVAEVVTNGKAEFEPVFTDMKKTSSEITAQIREISKQGVLVNNHKHQLATSKVDLTDVYLELLNLF